MLPRALLEFSGVEISRRASQVCRSIALTALNCLISMVLSGLRYPFLLHTKFTLVDIHSKSITLTSSLKPLQVYIGALEFVTRLTNVSKDFAWFPVLQSAFAV